jgi:hypothetical protein
MKKGREVFKEINKMKPVLPHQFLAKIREVLEA